jgi:pyridinium-3,5-bisthiocarboxylic acid mononucleotide nickel chelatase
VIGYLDCSTGVSGDKFLGALLDIGEASGTFTASDLQTTIAALAQEALVRVQRTTSYGIAAVGVKVEAAEQPTHRQWPDIETMLRSAELPEPVRANALRIFEELAIAEAAAHGTSVERVHFHEVGALDSIADVVGVCAGIHALGIDTLVASPVALGWGTVTTSHGLLPVPAPATAMLLAGIPTEPGSAEAELTTPTGAALVRVLVSSFGPMPPMTLASSGYGAGTRDIGMPNVCRLMLGEPADSLVAHRVALLETNIDHLPSEELAFVTEELLRAGALDVWQTPIVMKKGRSAIMLSVLTPAGNAETFSERIIELTGSLGVRHETLERTVAERECRLVDTPWGPARVKVGGGRVRPEHEDVARIAREHSLPYRAVADQIAQLAEDAG